MIKKTIQLLVCCLLTQNICAETVLTEAQNIEMLAMVTNINRASLTWRAAVIPQMLGEANWIAEKLKLPTHRPIQMADIQTSFIGAPWFRVLHGTNRFPDTIFGSHIFDANIPREQRLKALKIGIGGYLDTTNFEFGFDQGRLVHVMRLSEPNVEYLAHDLDKLVGKTSLIDTNGAYLLATQWLAAIDVDMPALNKLKWTVNQLHYKTREATNYVTLPLYYVEFGSKHYPASGNLKAFDEPLVSVEILGTTKEIQEILIRDNSFSCRPQRLITNVLDLIRTPDSKTKQLGSALSTDTNSIRQP